MKTYFQNPIIKVGLIFLLYLPTFNHLLATSSPDVLVFATLPSNPGSNDGLIDLMINAGTAPYQIKFSKDDGSGNFQVEYEVTAQNIGDEDYNLASVGNYKIEITDAHCASLILDIIVSMECNCELPILNYDASSCSLSWGEICNETGTGYAYFLQYNGNGTWTDIQVAGSSYIIPSGGNGEYRLKVSKESCPDIFSDEVSVSCSTTSCTCTAPSLSVNSTSCTISWTSPSCPGYTANLQVLNSSNVWVTLGNTTPYTASANGSHRVALTKAGCPDVYSNTVSITCFDPNAGCTCPAPTLSINSNTCSISWPAPSCPGYISSLQVLNSSNVWVNVGSTSPHTASTNGSHRLALTKAGCPVVYSNTVNVNCYNPNNGCTCPAPSLNLNTASCTLSWTVTSCSGYVATVQKLNNANVWENVGSTSPYSVTGNGSHRILLSKPGCPDVYSNAVSVTCYNPNSGCNCPAPSLNHNATACNLSWTPSACPGYSTTLQKLNSASGAWSNITTSTPYSIPQNQNGSYRVIASKPGCPDVESSSVYVTCSCTNTPTLTAFVMDGNTPGNSQTIAPGSNSSMSLSQSSPTGCVGDQIFIGFLSSEVNSNWTVSGQDLQVQNSQTSGGYTIFEIQLTSDPSISQGVLTFVSPCGDTYTLTISFDCCLNVDFSGTTNNVCDIMNILPTGGAEPYSFEISGTGTQGTVIQQNNPDIDFSVLGQDEEIILNITVMDANGCSITFDQSFAQCSGNCTTNVAGAPICQCVSMDGVGFDEESCSITGFAVGCSDGGSIHMFNSNNEQVGNVPFSNSTSDPQSLALMNEVLNTNGNDTYTIYFECGCGFSNPFTIDVSCLGFKSISNDGSIVQNIQFYPNPFNHGVYAKWISQQNSSMNIHVYNNLGQHVFDSKLDANIGDNITYLEAFENLPTGVYTIKVELNNKTSFSRVVKTK